MKIAVIGTGYVGLVTGTCFAETGNDVTCIDIDQDKIFRLNAGEITIYEPSLENLFKRNVDQGRLKFTSNLKDGINQAMVIFLALPTPQDEDGAADLSYVLSAAQNVAPLLTGYTVIVDKSTVPVGTGKIVYNTIMSLIDANFTSFDVVSNPEFLREGSAVEDFLKPDRVVIGTDSDQAFKIMEQLYAPMIRQGNPIYRMDIESAEMTKYAANAFLAMKISYMNEIANVCQSVGANVDQVRLGIGSDHRIGKSFLFPGIGWGGSCFPGQYEAITTNGNESLKNLFIKYKNGEKILVESFDENLNEREFKNVLEVTETEYEGELYRFTLENGNIFECTPEHIFPIINVNYSGLTIASDITLQDEFFENPKYVNIFSDIKQMKTDAFEFFEII